MLTTIAEITELEGQYQLATYKKMPVVAERGEGVWIYTSDGTRYLDLYGGHAVAGTGHCHPHVVKAIKEQSDKLLFWATLFLVGAVSTVPLAMEVLGKSPLPSAAYQG